MAARRKPPSAAPGRRAAVPARRGVLRGPARPVSAASGRVPHYDGRGSTTMAGPGAPGPGQTGE